MIESSDNPERGQLSWRWHAVVFLALLAFASLLLWGVYQPLMRQRARTFMERGDLFLERGRTLQNLADTSPAQVGERLEQGILTIHSALKSYEEVVRVGAMDDPEHPVIRNSREQMGALKPVIEQAILEVRTLPERGYDSSTIIPFLSAMERHAAKCMPRIEQIAAELVTGTTFRNAIRDLDYLHYAALPDFIESAREVQALFHTESSFDMAMSAYFFSVAFARDWTAPRLRLAELYHLRKWPEFTMLECLKVIKLDPASADADRAREILASYDGNHPEADYYVGLARFLQGDRADGTNRLRRFVARHPLIPNAPKAYHLLNHLDRGQEVFLKSFLRDEIWI